MTGDSRPPLMIKNSSVLPIHQLMDKLAYEVRRRKNSKMLCAMPQGATARQSGVVGFVDPQQLMQCEGARNEMQTQLKIEKNTGAGVGVDTRNLWHSAHFNETEPSMTGQWCSEATALKDKMFRLQAFAGSVLNT